MPGQLSFNFHDIAGVEVSSSSERIQDFFQNEYKHHRVDELRRGLPRVKLSVEKALPGVHPVGYTKHVHKLLARWWYRIKVSPDHVEIKVKSSRLGIPMIHHMLLHPSLRYLAANQDVLMLHAGAVCRDGKSLLFSGKGGAGKTTTTSLILAWDGLDFSPHADDYVFVDGQKSLAYITRSHLYQDILGWVPEVSTRLTLKERILLRLSGLIRDWSADGIKWPTRVPVERLWPDKEFCYRSEIKGLIYLSRGDDLQGPRLSPVKKAGKIVETLHSMNFREAGHYLHLLKKSASIPDLGEWLEIWRHKEFDMLAGLVTSIPLYRLDLPIKVDDPARYKRELTSKISALLS